MGNENASVQFCSTSRQDAHSFTGPQFPVFCSPVQLFGLKLAHMRQHPGIWTTTPTKSLSIGEKITSHFGRIDRVVPFRKNIVFLDGDLLHVFIRDFLSCLVLFANEAGTYAQTGLGFCGTDVVHDFLIGGERLAGPVL